MMFVPTSNGIISKKKTATKLRHFSMYKQKFPISSSRGAYQKRIPIDVNAASALIKELRP